MTAIDRAREIAILIQRRRFSPVGHDYPNELAPVRRALGGLATSANEALQETLTVHFDGDGTITVKYDSSPLAEARLNTMNPPEIKVQYFLGDSEIGENDSFVLAPNPNGSFGWLCKGYVEIGATAGQVAEIILERTLGVTQAHLDVGTGLDIGTD